MLDVNHVIYKESSLCWLLVYLSVRISILFVMYFQFYFVIYVQFGYCGCPDLLPVSPYPTYLNPASVRCLCQIVFDASVCKLSCVPCKLSPVYQFVPFAFDSACFLSALSAAGIHTFASPYCPWVLIHQPLQCQYGFESAVTHL